MTSMYGLSLGWRLAELPTSWAHQPRIERAPASIPLVGQEARRVCCVLRAAYAFFSVPIISVCDYAKSARAQAKRCRAVAKRTEERQARRHGGTMARWHDGTMARRHDGTMARWHDGTMARWHDGTMARIIEQALRLVPFREKMARICGCERWFCERERKREF